MNRKELRKVRHSKEWRDTYKELKKALIKTAEDINHGIDKKQGNEEGKADTQTRN